MCSIYVAIPTRHHRFSSDLAQHRWSGEPEDEVQFSRCAGLGSLHSITATEMAALRRLFLALNKPAFNFSSLPRSNRFGEKINEKRGAQRCIAAGICLAAGGAVVYYCYREMYDDRHRKGYRLNRGALLQSLPAVAAKEKVP